MDWLLLLLQFVGVVLWLVVMAPAVVLVSVDLFYFLF